MRGLVVEYVYKVEENDKKPVRRPSRHISSLAVATGEEEEGTDARLCGEDTSFLSLSPLATGTASGMAEAMGLDAGVGCVGVGDTGEVVQDEEADVVGCEGMVFAGGGEAGLVRMKYGARVERLKPNILGGRAACLSAAAGTWAGVGLCAFTGELASCATANDMLSVGGEGEGKGRVTRQKYCTASDAERA